MLHEVDAPALFARMHEAHPLDEVSNRPGYIQYLVERGRVVPDDQRVANYVIQLTESTIRSNRPDPNRPDRSRAERARYWYRSLGPLNPLDGVEPDLVQAAELSYRPSFADPELNAKVNLDNAHMLTELGRVAPDETTKRSAWTLASAQVQYLRDDPAFPTREPMFRINTHVLAGDLGHDITRYALAGTLEPTTLSSDRYFPYDTAFKGIELSGIADFTQEYRNGITDDNVGGMFGWHGIIARRHAAYAAEEIDTTVVRGASSREDAQWRGEPAPSASSVALNHDIVVQRPGETHRLQMKTVAGARVYEKPVVVEDYKDTFNEPFLSLDAAARQIGRRIRTIQLDYQGELRL